MDNADEIVREQLWKYVRARNGTYDKAVVAAISKKLQCTKSCNMLTEYKGLAVSLSQEFYRERS
jgi:hypothetical protein